jgi:hypothetical protein
MNPNLQTRGGQGTLQSAPVSPKCTYIQIKNTNHALPISISVLSWNLVTFYFPAVPHLKICC